MESLCKAKFQEALPLTSESLISEFSSNLDSYSFSDLLNLLGQESNHLMRIILRAAIAFKEKGVSFSLTHEKAERRARQSEIARRRNFVRRTFKIWGLFSLPIIKSQYPEYPEEMITQDLIRKKRHVRIKKSKPRRDFRAAQLNKYEVLYHVTEQTSREFSKICERISSLTNADRQKLPIHLTVTLGCERYDYVFKWNTSERQIKEFHTLANTKGVRHEDLQEYRDKNRF